MGPLTSTRLIRPCASQKSNFHARAKCSIYTVVSNSLTTCGELSSLFFDATGHRGNHLQHRNYQNQWPSLWKRFCTFLPASQGPVLLSCLLHSGVDFTCRAFCFFSFFHLFNYLFFVHLTTQSHVHHFTQVAVIVEVLKEPLRLLPLPVRLRKGLCASEPGLFRTLGDKFISLRFVRSAPLLLLLYVFIILRKKAPRDVHTVRLCTYYHAEPVWWKCVPESFLFYNRVFSFEISDRGIFGIVARTL